LFDDKFTISFSSIGSYDNSYGAIDAPVWRVRLRNKLTPGPPLFEEEASPFLRIAVLGLT